MASSVGMLHTLGKKLSEDACPNFIASTQRKIGLAHDLTVEMRRDDI